MGVLSASLTVEPEANPNAVWQPSDRATGSSFSFVSLAYYDPGVALGRCCVFPPICHGLCEGDCGSVEER
jgi:hypothetical protein